MSNETEDETPRIGCYWIPTTPAKPNLCQTSDLMEFGKGFSNDRCCIIHGENISRLPVPHNMGMLNNGTNDVRSFGELLARAHAGKMTDDAFPRNDIEANTAFAPPRVQPQMQDRSSSYSRPFFDLNTVPESNAEESSSKNAGSEFEPITPEKSVKRPDSAMQQHIISIDDVNTQKYAQETGNVEGHHKGEVQSHPSINFQLRASVSSTLLQENHTPDKGSTEEADLSKTLQRKTKKKKHRPRVKSEGQPRTTRKQKVESSGRTQDATPVKRKPGRPKANSNTPRSEGESNGTDIRENTPLSVDVQPAKRIYLRRNKMNKPEDTIDKRAAESTNPNTLRKTRSSCRRSLNFNLEGQVNDESFLNCQSPEKLVTKAGNAKSDTAIANELAGSADQELQDYVARQTQHFPSSSPCNNTDLLQSFQQLADNGLYSREKCQAVLSDGSHGHDKGTNKIQPTINPSDYWTAKILSGAACSGTCFAPEREVRGLKRQHVDAPVEPGFSNTNTMGIVGNTLQASAATFGHDAGENGWCFPAISKRKRTEKRHNVVAFSSPSDSYGTLERHHLGTSTTKPSTSDANQGPSSAQHNSINLLAGCLANATHDGRKFLSDLLVAATTETVKRKRSKGTTRLRDLTSLMEIGNQMPTYQGVRSLTSRVECKIEILREPQTCMEALVAYNCSTNSIPKRKQRSKRSTISNGFVQNRDFATQSMGSPLAITWKIPLSIDSITEQLSELNLNAEISEESARNLSMAYRMHYQEQHSLVPYQSIGAIVPFDNSFNQTKRRQPRAKVDLDDETTRVWKLLLENINSEGIDGENDEKAKWWEEERRIFKGRSDSFIARMHLVQGDRRFSPWKGSVVDSVVGVFLTQNVSDHLSSSAYMSLVARYPAKSENHLAGSTEVQEPDSCMVGSDNTFRSDQKILDNLFCGEESSVLLEFGNDDVREVNSNRSPGISSDGSIPRNNSGGKSSDAFKHVPVTSHESCCCTNKSISPITDGRDKEDAISSQTLEISSQSSAYSSTAHTTEISESCLRNTSEEPTALTQSNEFAASSEELVQVAGTEKNVVYDKETVGEESGQVAYQPLSEEPTLCHSCDSVTLATVELSQESSKVLYSTIENETFIAATCGSLSEAASQTTAVIIEDELQFSKPDLRSPTEVQVETEKLVVNIADLTSTEGFLVYNQSEMKEVSSDIPFCSQNSKDTGESSTKADECTKVNSIKNDDVDYDPRGKAKQDKVKGEKTERGKKKVDWDRLREHAKKGGKQRGKTSNTMDSVDWDAVRCADVHEVAGTIKDRGMNNVLAGRIKDFLNRVVEDHGSIDLEWLRDVPPDDAKEYLLSIKGLGLKSVECVRLLTLHHLAFPVDTNVGRIAVRLGWVPLQPLPESLQLHLLELYPVLESIQKYLWPRLCKLDQKTLYELHYQMITFGKVFCTKSKPNCNACPMRGECRHFASAFASARLSLPAPEEKGIVTTTDDRTAGQADVQTFTNPLQLPSNIPDVESIVSNCQPIIEVPPSPEPTIEEVPATPDQSNIHVPDIEEAFIEDPDEIPTIQLNMEEFTHNLQKIMQQTTELQDGDMTKALVALTAEAASIPVPKLKNVSRLRTEHQVYELPDSHPILEGLDKREPDDPCPYMLAIWTPGETVNSIEPPKRQCNSQESEKLCNDETCSSCNSIREATLDTVRGSLLIPCRTAMRGSFPLNGTYFQVNEVFADHESSSTPMNIPRQWLWNLPRRTVYFGTSIPTIFKGLSTEGIQYCFWRGFVCVRAFERKTRAPRPLAARLHFPASHKGKAKIDENQS